MPPAGAPRAAVKLAFCRWPGEKGGKGTHISDRIMARLVKGITCLLVVSWGTNKGHFASASAPVAVAAPILCAMVVEGREASFKDNPFFFPQNNYQSKNQNCHQHHRNPNSNQYLREPPHRCRNCKVKPGMENDAAISLRLLSIGKPPT